MNILVKFNNKLNVKLIKLKKKKPKTYETGFRCRWRFKGGGCASSACIQ